MSDQQDEPAEAEEPVQVEAVVVEPPRRRIAISMGPQAVEVEGPDDLVDLEHAAQRLWALTGGGDHSRVWAGGMGFAAEIGPQE